MHHLHFTIWLTEAASTSDAVCLITYVQQLKREVLAWEKQVDVYREAQRILERQRYVSSKSKPQGKDLYLIL